MVLEEIVKILDLPFGWVSFNNLLIQFGILKETHAAGNPYLFPIAYKTWVVVVGCMGVHPSSGYRSPCYETVTGFCVVGTLSTAITFNWLAIGDSNE